MKLLLFIFMLLWLLLPSHVDAQEYSIHAVEQYTNKPIPEVHISLRYDCVTSGSPADWRHFNIKCKFIVRKTGHDGTVYFPEAGTVKNIDDIFPSSIPWAEICCDISKPVIPGMGTITFQRRSIGEMLHYIFIGD